MFTDLILGLNKLCWLLNKPSSRDVEVIRVFLYYGVQITATELFNSGITTIAKLVGGLLFIICKSSSSCLYTDMDVIKV